MPSTCEENISIKNVILGNTPPRRTKSRKWILSGHWSQQCPLHQNRKVSWSNQWHLLVFGIEDNRDLEIMRGLLGSWSIQVLSHLLHQANFLIQVPSSVTRGGTQEWWSTFPYNGYLLERQEAHANLSVLVGNLEKHVKDKCKCTKLTINYLGEVQY